MKQRRRPRLTVWGKADQRYALLDSETCPEIHVMPCFDDGSAVKPHIPHRACRCSPQADDCREYLFIHNHIQ